MLHDNQSFDLLFTTCKERFVSFAYSYLRDRAVAEDIVMESFITYWENRSNLHNEENIPAYVLRIVKNKCLNHLRSCTIHLKAEQQIRSHQDRIMQANLASLEACDPQELFHKEMEKIVKQTLKHLSARTREMFIMNRFSNYSYKEIAQHFNTSEKSVGFHISKALKVLRVALKDYLTLLAWISLT